MSKIIVTLLQSTRIKLFILFPILPIRRYVALILELDLVYNSLAQVSSLGLFIIHARLVAAMLM